MGKKLTFLAICALCFQATLQAQIFTMTNNNSTASVNVGTQAGMFNWNVQGANVLTQQSFWFGAGTNGNANISSLTLGSSGLNNGGRGLDSQYSSATGFNIDIAYLLTGGATVLPGHTAVSDIAETITINNTSASTLNLRFYQFSHFNLGNPSTVQLGTNLSGLFNEARVTATGANVSETVTAPGANEGEVAVGNATLNALNNGTPYILNNSTGPLSGDVTWALQWDLSIDPGGSAIISKDKNVKITAVPEPSTWALIGLGLAGLYTLRRRHAAA